MAETNSLLNCRRGNPSASSNLALSANKKQRKNALLFSYGEASSAVCWLKTVCHTEKGHCEAVFFCFARMHAAAERSSISPSSQKMATFIADFFCLIKAVATCCCDSFFVESDFSFNKPSC